MKKIILVVSCLSVFSSWGYAQAMSGSIVDETIPSFLATPASGSVKTIPVVVLRYLPTQDGINLDVSKATDYWDLGNITLDQLKDNIDMYLAGLKFSLEEGSKFHGYKDPAAVPYLGYKVVKFWTIYGQVPISTTYQLGEAVVDGELYGVFEPDFIKIYSDFGLQHYIEDNGVKEIWIWFGQCAMPGWPSYDPAIHVPANFVEYVESNMASPSTGDISNSHRFADDIPIANKTAVVYCYNFRRTQAEAVHNHGHQLEASYRHAAEKQDGTSSLFIHDFSGWGIDYSTPPLGRAGDCHHPPNTINDYDYENTTMVESDIEEWCPAVGPKKLVNKDTWANITYAWPGGYTFPQRTESQWYIYWMQNMPGYQSAIPYGSKFVMTNWWQFTADWDLCSTSNIGLYEESPLPVELTCFEAVPGKNNVALRWTTATETNNYGFDVERKTKDRWTTLCFMPGHGTTNAPHTYEYIDGAVSGRVMYRLKQLDRDGKFTYSKEVDAAPHAVPSILALMQNYPNPFNPATNITFTVPADGRAVLKVYNTIGQEVASLFNGEASAGTFNTVQFDATGLPSGIYVSRLEYRGSTLQKKVLLIK